jgi:two-component system sensor histidine kinase VicK
MDELQTLQKENAELKQMNAVKSDWISISAHQLRTSLAANKWMLKMFLDQDFGDITHEQAGFMKKAYDATEHMLGLVNDMLAINHAQDGVTMEYKYVDVDMVSFVDSIIFDFHGESFKKKVEIIFLKPETPLHKISVDEAKIRVVIQNLIENALKYSKSGESVIVSVLDHGDTLCLSVKDQGIGIPLEEQPKIFEKFYRATNAKQTDEVGSGIGLYATKMIVEAHGGKLWFESKENEGTTFFVSLPKTR